MEINSANVKKILSGAGMTVMNLIRDSFDELVSQECADVFDKTVELGIENTMRALIEVDAGDSAIVSALREVWGLPRKEAVGRVAWLKRKIAVERLKEFLLLKGRRSKAADSFCREYAVQMRLSNDDGLFDLWDKPEQLYSKLLEMGTDPLPVAHQVPCAQRTPAPTQVASF